MATQAASQLSGPARGPRTKPRGTGQWAAADGVPALEVLFDVRTRALLLRRCLGTAQHGAGYTCPPPGIPFAAAGVPNLEVWSSPARPG